jgi:predicted RNA-binding protein (TIGR00451 family)
LNLVVVNGSVLFFNVRDGPYFPTLRVLHKCASSLRSVLRCAAHAAADPDMMPRLRVDKGAVRFVFAGANIMCPGLTSSGAIIHDEVPEETPVARLPALDAPTARLLLRRPSTRRGRSTRSQSA